MHKAYQVSSHVRPRCTAWSLGSCFASSLVHFAEHVIVPTSTFRPPDTGAVTYIALIFALRCMPPLAAPLPFSPRLGGAFPPLPPLPLPAFFGSELAVTLASTSATRAATVASSCFSLCFRSLSSAANPVRDVLLLLLLLLMLL